jgi:hypothetical protein
VKKLDPNLESLSSIKVRVSQSTLSLMNPFSGDASTRSSSDLRRSILASSEIGDSASKNPIDMAGEEE